VYFIVAFDADRKLAEDKGLVEVMEDCLLGLEQFLDEHGEEHMTNFWTVRCDQARYPGLKQKILKLAEGAARSEIVDIRVSPLIDSDELYGVEAGTKGEKLEDYLE